jgi:hypothetical protein
VTRETLALAFVDRLVPGRFEEARRMLDARCEYVFEGRLLRGDATIAAFEQSHRDALTKFDRIEYLPGRVAEVIGDEIVIQVFDQVTIGTSTHTYTDRLAIEVDDARATIVRIEHRPFPEARAALTAFLETARRG